MKKYLFLTYGEPGWRGVQMRAIRMAQYMPKEEVLFWNCDDSEFIRSYGFAVETKEAYLINPKDIIFPKGVEIVIFADLPTNLFFNYAVFIAAIRQQKKIVICEQLYRTGQMSEGVFRQFALQSDLFLVNGLSSFTSEETGSVKIVPPQIEMVLRPSVRSEIRKKYGLSPNRLVLFGAGYNPQVLKKIESITKQLAKKGYPVTTIISGSKEQKTIQRKGECIYLPFQSGEEYFKLLYAADVILVKFGFLQILESLALHKPTIVLGEGGYVLRTPDVLDPRLQEVLRFEETISESTLKYLEKLLSDEDYRERLIAKMKKLHNGDLYGAREAAKLVMKLTKKKTLHRLAKKKVAILVNDEILEKEKWLESRKHIYPLCFLLPMPSQKTNKGRLPVWTSRIPIAKLNTEQHELLPHSFKQLFLFSKRALDGLVDILPWYEEWLSELERILDAADVIYVTPLGKKLLTSFLTKPEIATKVVGI